MEEPLALELAFSSTTFEFICITLFAVENTKMLCKSTNTVNYFSCYLCILRRDIHL